MNQLKQRRKAARLTTTALAAQAEAALPEIPPVRIRAEYITDIETGRNKNPSSLILLRLAAVLRCKPEELLMPPPDEDPRPNRAAVEDAAFAAA